MPMVIVHIVSYFTPIWKYQEYYLAREQVLQGHEVHLITSNLNFPLRNYESVAKPVLGPRLKNAGSEVVEGFTIHYLPTYFEFWARVWLKGWKGLLKTINPDLICCHGITQPFFLTLIHSSVWNCPIIVDEHVLYSDLSASPIKQLFYRTMGIVFSKKIVARCKKIVAISTGVTELLSKLMGIHTSNIQLIPLGSDVSLFYPSFEVGQEFRNTHGISPDAKVVGYTGKIWEFKKVHFLIDGANEWQGPRVEILIVGEAMPEYEAFLKEKIKNSKVRVTMLKAVDHECLPAVYNACDILAWPAHQTISTINASACGKPIICSDHLKERFANGQGIGIPSGNYEAFKEALFHLLQNPEEARLMGKKGLEWVGKNVSWSTLNKKLLE